MVTLEHPVTVPGPSPNRQLALIRRRSRWSLHHPGPKEHSILVAEIGAGMEGIPVVADQDIPWEQTDFFRPG